MVSTAQQTISEANSNFRTLLFYLTGKFQFLTSERNVNFICTICQNHVFLPKNSKTKKMLLKPAKHTLDRFFNKIH